MALQADVIQEATSTIPHYYLCNYVPLTSGKDELSRSLPSFSDFLIIDDILTTGTTAISIATAIREKIPAARILIFTLAKVDYDLQMNEQATFEGTHFRWMEKAWEVREPEPQYDSLSSLKRKILADSF